MTRFTKKMMIGTGLAVLLFLAACGDNSSETTSVKPILPGKEYKTYKTAVYAKLDSVLLDTIRQQRTDIIDTVNQQRTADGLPDLSDEEETEVLANLFEAFSRHVSNEKSVYLGMFKEEYAETLKALNIVTDLDVDANTSLRTEETLATALHADLNKSAQQQLLSEKVSEDFTAFAATYLQSEPFAKLLAVAGQRFTERVHSSVMVQNTAGASHTTADQVKTDLYNHFSVSGTNVSPTLLGSGGLMGSSACDTNLSITAPQWIEKIRNGSFYFGDALNPAGEYTPVTFMENGDTVGASWPDAYGSREIITLRGNTLTFTFTGKTQTGFPHAGGYNPNTDYLPGITGINLDDDTYAEYIYTDNNTLYLVDDVKSGFSPITSIPLQNGLSAPQVTGGRVFYSVAAADVDLTGVIQIYVAATQIPGATDGYSLSLTPDMLKTEFYKSRTYHYTFSNKTEAMALSDTYLWDETVESTSSLPQNGYFCASPSDSKLLLQNFQSQQTDLDNGGEVWLGIYFGCLHQESNGSISLVNSNQDGTNMQGMYQLSGALSTATRNGGDMVPPNAAYGWAANQFSASLTAAYYVYPHVYNVQNYCTKFSNPNITAVVTPPPCMNGEACSMNYTMSASTGDAESAGFTFGVSVTDSIQVTAEGSGAGASFGLGESITGSAESSTTISETNTLTVNSDCKSSTCDTIQPTVLFYGTPVLLVYAQDLVTKAAATLSKVGAANSYTYDIPSFDSTFGTTLNQDLFGGFDFTNAQSTDFVYGDTPPSFLKQWEGSDYAYKIPCTSPDSSPDSSVTCTIAQAKLSKVSVGASVTSSASVSIIDGISTAGFGMTFDMQDKLTITASESLSNTLTETWGSGFSGGMTLQGGSIPSNITYVPQIGLYKTSAQVNGNDDYFMIVSGWIANE